MSKKRIIFATFVSDESDQFCTRLLIDSLRAFGGTMSQSRFMVFSVDQKPDARIISCESVDFFTLNGKNQEAQYYFADKVRAWAQAESFAKEHFNTLVWIDPVCLVINPPTLFSLDNETLAAFRPVHIRNIGQLFRSDLDQFWHSIFSQCQISEPLFPVTSFIDSQEIYPYFNTHCFSINPKMGVLEKTLGHLNILNSNQEFMNNCCSNELYKIFLFQSVLAVTLLKETTKNQIRLLTPDYSYPLHLIDKISPDLAINKLDDLTVMVYEEKLILENSLSKLEVSLTMRQWLENYITIQ